MSDSFHILRRLSGPYHLNTYFLSCARTKETLIIDPGDRAKVLLDLAREKGMRPVGLVMTHGHADQFFRADRFKEKWDIPYCMHKGDRDFFSDPLNQAATRKAVDLPPPHTPDRVLEHGDIIEFGSHELRVIHTPGHTPGSCCLLCGNDLFSGDTLFVGEAGRTDLPGGDLDLMIRSIKERILPLDPKTRIHPGHHHPGTPLCSTLEREMEENIHITDFILDP